MDAPSSPSPLDIVSAYHEVTKHHPGRFARSLGSLDWDNQPDPYRTWIGTERIALPLPARDDTPPYDLLYEPSRVTHRPQSLSSLSSWLFHALALSAHKSIGDARWSLRVNPSSGNLHPTEGWFLGVLPDHASSPGVFHYAPAHHTLERRASLHPAAWERLRDGLPDGAMLLLLSSIPWRESWKYGERAWRYCLHDVGHALGALRLSAAALGWSLQLRPDLDDDMLARLVGLHRAQDLHLPAEVEWPDLLAVMTPGPRPAPVTEAWPTTGQLPREDEVTWFGRAAPLSREHHDWELVHVAELAARRTPGTRRLSRPAAEQRPPSQRSTASGDTPVSAGHVIRTRRSAVSMDATSTLSAERFFAMLARTHPALTDCPWDTSPTPPLVDLGLFIHRVDGLAPGLYVLQRREDENPDLRAATDPSFLWERPDGCPTDLPLFLCKPGDARRQAAGICCGQDIAGDGVFSLGMLAVFTPALERWGPSVYRHLHWEAGLIGQVLYLEAEAAGLRATGIGCFFDDSMHAVFGLTDKTFQSVYHFTVGGALEDDRLGTEPAYPALPPGVI